MSLSRFNSIMAVDFPSFIFPRLSIPVSILCGFPFCVWVFPGASCSYTHASWNFCQTSFWKDTSLLKSRAVSLHPVILTAARILNCTISRSLSSGCPWLHLPCQPLLVGENKVQHSTSACSHLEKAVVITVCWEPPGLPCCAVPTTDVRVIGVPQEDQDLTFRRTWGCSYLSIGAIGLILLLVRQSVADLHYVICPCPPFSPDPWALSWSLIHPQTELHILHQVIDMKRDTPSSSSRPVLPTQPVFIHSNTGMNHRSHPTTSLWFQ